MAFHYLLLFAFLTLAFAGSHGALPDEDYWKSVFPNTPMPKALTNLLPPADPSKEFKVVYSPNVNYGYGDLTMKSKSIIAPDSVTDTSHKKEGNGTPSKGFKVVFSPNENYGYGDLTMKSKSVIAQDSVTDTSHRKERNGAPSKGFKGNKNSMGMHMDSNPNEEIGVQNAAINETLYLLQKDLYPGKMVKLPLLIETRGKTTFLPHRIVKSMPFSSDKLPEILKHYLIEAESRETNTMNETTRNCERASIDGEDKYCAASLKSVVNLSVSKLGKNIQLLSSEVQNETKSPIFSIGKGVQNMVEEEIVCHKMQYPYAVFLCHSINRTAVYKVPLVGIDGKKKANALAVCHKDTSSWNSDHPSFKILNVKPGTVPVCHFPVRDTLVWVSN